MSSLTHRRTRATTRDDWRTPPILIKPISERFRFTGDACASASNAYAPEWLSQEDDALTASWERLGPSVWMNPPYSLSKLMVARARRMSAALSIRVVVLVPSTTDVAWWHEDVMPYASELWHYRGRISFVDPVKLQPIQGNPVGSVLVVFDGQTDRQGPPVLGSLCSKTGRPINEAQARHWMASNVGTASRVEALSNKKETVPCG